MIARFIHYYGAGMWLNELWPTRDKIIPFKMFYALLSQLDHLEAEHELIVAQGVMHGYSLARSGKDSKVKSAMRRLIRRAYPQTSGMK